MYQLYITNKNYSSWSLRPWVLMQQLGIAFEERLQTFESEDNYAKFRGFSPSGTVPCLVDTSPVDGDRTVWDVAAISETWQEPGHEEEAKAAGTIISDRRVSSSSPEPAI